MRPFGYFRDMSSVEEIERAVEKLPQKEFAKLAAWMDQHEAETIGDFSIHAAKSDAGWFDTYMSCPHSFKIPPRKKQLYRPKS